MQNNPPSTHTFELVSKWPRAKALQLRSVVERLNLCSCGSDAHWECIRELLSEAERHTERSFARDKWFEFGAKVIDGWGLTEHGTGIWGAWLTADGKLLLEFLRDFGTEDHDMNSNSGHPLWAIEYSWGEKQVEDELDSYAQWVFELES